MLTILVPAREYYDEVNEKFVYTREQVLQMEHSLVSISKWEATWNKPFLVKDTMTDEETLDYFRCMTITKNVDPLIYMSLSVENVDQIRAYINNPMTATTINQKNSKPNRSIVTSEIIYYWMIALEIPQECEKWHLNRLITLIQVCNIKNAPAKKMSKKDVASRVAAINEANKSRLGTRG